LRSEETGLLGNVGKDKDADDGDADGEYAFDQAGSRTRGRLS
jgi:hypothetical protein